jgi:hypothetical protein
VCAAKTAVRITGEKHYEEIAQAGFEWFFGRNLVGESLYDPVSGGCFDGLHQESVNLNQGAESTISYLMAHLAMVSNNNNRLMVAP